MRAEIIVRPDFTRAADLGDAQDMVALFASSLHAAGNDPGGGAAGESR